jgi:hypothetical protein
MMKRANPARLPGHAIAGDGDNLQEISFVKLGAVQFWHVTDIRSATSGISALNHLLHRCQRRDLESKVYHPGVQETTSWPESTKHLVPSMIRV